MCGIAGLIAADGASPDLLRRMTDTIEHRGPDDQGQWIDGAVGLGHRRLSIVDLSPSGHQPMPSPRGRFVISYNGEVYNHADLRAELEAAGGAPESGWRGHSDTETLVAGIEHWGLEETLSRAVGMFAFALWDRRERILHLVRDRFGEKPLYYGWVGRDFVFASELKAIRAHPGFDREIDRRALGQFAARAYIAAPWSIYRNIYKLEPGCVLSVAEGAAHRPRTAPPIRGERDGIRLSRYWSYRDVVLEGLADPIADEGGAVDCLEAALGQAIRDQSVADVPVGAFLSGGIDSSTIVALYQKYSGQPVRTFSIGFEEAGYDEAVYAKEVARHLGSVHQEHYVSVAEARSVIPLLPQMYDEPFADPSQVPTYLVSKFARSEVTVALTGDGGDELFAGYNRHFLAPRLWEHIARVPRPLRAVAGRALGRVPARAWSGASRLVGGARSGIGTKVQKALRVAGSARRFDDVYESFLDQWHGEKSPVIGGGRPLGFDLDLGGEASDTERMMYCDSVSYLPDDILAKVDRASMAVSLETRVPFLDHRVAALAARIPLSMKVHGGEGKQILRKLLYREAPREMFDRPKAGFAMPIGEWLTGPLRPWAEDLLDPSRMRSEGFFDASSVSSRWKAHVSGQRDATTSLWPVLMFQAWQRAQG